MSWVDLRYVRTRARTLSRAARALAVTHLVACSSSHRDAHHYVFRGGFECGHIYECAAPGMPMLAPHLSRIAFEPTSDARGACRSPVGAYVDDDGLLRREESDVVVGRIVRDMGQSYPMNAPGVSICYRVELPSVQ